MNFSTAEELDQQKNKINNERRRKLTDDRKPKHGDSKLAKTDGLKPVKPKGKGRNQHIVIDDQVFDLKRVRNLGDLLSEDDIAEMEGWYDD